MIPAKKSFAAIRRSPRVLLAINSGVERRRDQTPFRRRVGMGKAAAKRAAHADRIMRDMAHDHAEQLAEWIVDHGLMKCRMANARADGEGLSVACNLVEPGYLVDVDEMRGLGEAERHDRHKALSTRQDAAVLWRDVGQKSSTPRRASSARGG